MKKPLPEEFQGLRTVTAAEMSVVDRRAIHEFGIPALVLMENAGKAVAEETASFLKDKLGKDPSQSLITICCGRGNNGGDGLVAARYLKSLGAEVKVYMARPKRDGHYTPEVGENIKRAAASGVSIQELGEDSLDLEVRLKSSDIVVDALLGTGASGKPAGDTHEMIRRIMAAGKPVVSIDIPSGLHPDTGYHSGVFVSASLTLTLGLPKKGLLAPHAQKNVGELRVLDIGFPETLLNRP